MLDATLQSRLLASAPSSWEPRFSMSLRRSGLNSKHPPLGDFVTVDGVRLHYVERGAGPPVVLVHGNATMLQDWIVSGALDALAQSHRVIAFDRPGFGYSERPRSRVWTPTLGPNFLAKAIAALGIKAPTLVGHPRHTGSDRTGLEPPRTR